MNIPKDYHNNNIILNNEYEHNQIEHYNNINNINRKDMVGGINYMYPQTKTGYDHYYDINQHMMIDSPNKINNNETNVDNNKMDDDVSDNKIKNLVDEITNNIDNMENIYEKYESSDNNENSNKKSKKKNKNSDPGENEKNNYDIYFEKWKDSIVIFIIYIILSLPSIQTFIGKYIKYINPDPITCTVPMYGVVIYGIILSIIYYVVKNKILCS